MKQNSPSLEIIMWLTWRKHYDSFADINTH